MSLLARIWIIALAGNGILRLTETTPYYVRAVLLVITAGVWVYRPFWKEE